MKTSQKWIAHFKQNAFEKRVDWTLQPVISESETSSILESLQAWQLGETSDGAHLLNASTLYANRIQDPDYIEAVKLFIKEEQKHGNNLGKYLDAIKSQELKKTGAIACFERSDTLIPTWRYGHWQ